MMKKPIRPILIAVIVTAFAADRAVATLPVVSFSGSLTAAHDFVGGQLDPSIVVGADFAGSYAISTEGAVDLDPRPDWGLYRLDTSMNVRIGDVEYDAPNVEILLVLTLGFGPGQIYNASSRDFTAGGLSVDSMGISLQTHLEDLFLTDAIPTELDLADFDYRDFVLNAPYVSVKGTVIDLTVTPEPNSAALLVSGVLGVLCAMRRHT